MIFRSGVFCELRVSRQTTQSLGKTLATVGTGVARIGLFGACGGEIVLATTVGWDLVLDWA